MAEIGDASTFLIAAVSEGGGHMDFTIQVYCSLPLKMEAVANEL